MHSSDLHFFPLTLPFLLGLFLLMGVLIALIEVGILEYCYTKIGVDRRYLFTVLLLSFFGSYVNIPVAHLPSGPWKRASPGLDCSGLSAMGGNGQHRTGQPRPMRAMSRHCMPLDAGDCRLKRSPIWATVSPSFGCA